MKISIDTRTINALPEPEWARLVQGREIQLETYLIPQTGQMDERVRKYLNSIIVYQLLRGKVEGTPAEILKLPNVITREDAHALFEMLGLSALSQIKEVKVCVKHLLVDACYGCDVALNTLREKNERAAKRAAAEKLPQFEDYFGGIKTLKALKESSLTSGDIVACIQARDGQDDIDWGLLFEVVDEGMEKGWIFKIINDRLRRSGERNQIRSMSDLQSRKRRLSSSDSESGSEPAGKMVKFSDLPEQLEEGEEHPFPVPQLQAGSKAAAVMQTITQITGMSPETSPKLACIGRALQRREARYGASKHQLWTSLSKTMLTYVSSKLFPEEHVHLSLGVDDSAESPVSVTIHQ
jgi:hypothetical protein